MVTEQARDSGSATEKLKWRDDFSSGLLPFARALLAYDMASLLKVRDVSAYRRETQCAGCLWYQRCSGFWSDLGAVSP